MYDLSAFHDFKALPDIPLIPFAFPVLLPIMFPNPPAFPTPFPIPFPDSVFGLRL